MIAPEQEGLVATKKKGLFTVSGEWAKHLRKWGKRVFWKGERKPPSSLPARTAEAVYSSPPSLHRIVLIRGHCFGEQLRRRGRVSAFVSTHMSERARRQSCHL
jgi:hypothetical protein